jgi:hypothetical protein
LLFRSRTQTQTQSTEHHSHSTHNCNSQRKDVDITKDRPEIVKTVYKALVDFCRLLGESIEIAQFEKGRYSLFRTDRIFAHVNVTKTNVRLVINLKTRHERPIFFKYYDEDPKAVQHCCSLNSLDELKLVHGLLTLAHLESLARAAASTGKRGQAAASTEDAPKKQMSIRARAVTVIPRRESE